MAEVSLRASLLAKTMMDHMDVIWGDGDLRIRKYASDLVGEATGGDSYYIEKLADHDEITRDDVIDVLREAKVPIAKEIVSDVDRIFDGDEPEYFLPHDRVVELYKRNHGFESSWDEQAPIRSSDVLRHIGDGVQSFLNHLHDRSYWLLTPYRRGAACVEEQKFFYETDEWKNRSTVVRIMDRFTCRHCGRSGNEVHHDEHIYSVFSAKFYRNFDVCRLRCLCNECHATFHRSHVRGISHFVGGEAADLKRRGLDRTTLERLHDAARECRFCFREAHKAA